MAFWQGSVLLYCEERFCTIKGHDETMEVIAAIEAGQTWRPEEQRKAA